jgi:hypothetical protein
MDINRIFSVFTPIKTVEDTIDIDFLQHPGFKIGVFKKQISYLPYFYKAMLKQYGHGLNEEKKFALKEILKHQIFNKAYNYLYEIDPIVDRENIEVYMDDEFYKALNYALDYFISEEEYEKCSFLKKFDKEFGS